MKSSINKFVTLTIYIKSVTLSLTHVVVTKLHVKLTLLIISYSRSIFLVKCKKLSQKVLLTVVGIYLDPQAELSLDRFYYCAIYAHVELVHVSRVVAT